MVRFAPPRLAKLVALAVHARLHQDGHLAPKGVQVARPTALELLPSGVAIDSRTRSGTYGAAEGALRMADYEYGDDFGKQRPKRPELPFDRYMEHLREEQASGKAKQRVPWVSMEAYARTLWKGLGEEGQAPYEEAYRTEKAEYDIAFAHWYARRSASRDAWLFFLQEHLVDSRKRKGAKYSVIEMEARQKWKELSPEDRRVYQERLESFMKPLHEAWLEEHPPAKRPKRPMWPVDRYIARARKNQGFRRQYAEIDAAATAEWEAMGEEERYPYEEAYRVDKAKYDQDFAAWWAQDILAQNAWTIFLQDLLSNHRGMNFSVIQQKAREQWAKMSSDERHTYERRMYEFQEPLRELWRKEDAKKG